MINLEGTVTDIRFRSEDSFYTVFSLDTEDGSIIAVGKIPQINVGDLIKVSGNLIYHNLYGEQIQITSYEKIMPNTTVQIEKYLASGIFPFIAKKTAKNIVDKFGIKSLDIMTYEPERLKDIQGLGKKKIQKIHDVIVKEQYSRNAFIYLQGLGIGNKLAFEIFKKYKNKTIETVKKNPYLLIEDIRGVGFNIADKIALKNNVKKDSPFRISAGIIYYLNFLANTQGDCFAEYEKLIEDVSDILDISIDLIENQIEDLVIGTKLTVEDIHEKKVVYLQRIYDIEKNIVSNILKLKFFEYNFEVSDIDKLLEDIEKEENIQYSKTQKIAIEKAVKNNIIVITGGPGTGKTTIIKAIIKVLSKIGKKYILSAPTGRAAKRIEESTGESSYTIHRMLGYKSIEDENRENYLEYNEENPLNTDVIIIDEMSMVDVFLINNVLKAITLETKLILVGDADQLQSVGAGNVLRDLIDSEVVESVKLDIIFRQSNESNIVKNAHLINSGKLPILNEKDKDFFFIKTKNDNEALETIVDLVKNRLPIHYGVDPFKDIQVLSPTKKGVCGIDNLNLFLQNALNPKEFNKNEISYQNIIFRENDKIMQIKNNYDINLVDKFGNISSGLFNGDMGYIRNVFEDNSTIEAIIDENRVKYSFKEFQEITLSYATTIHKSQGSEFPIVIIPMISAPYMLLTRSVLYTGITRSKKLVVLVGDENIMKKMIENKFTQKRNTGLAYHLKKGLDTVEELYGF